jgi:hypothetical protein
VLGSHNLGEYREFFLPGLEAADVFLNGFQPIAFFLTSGLLLRVGLVWW